MYREWQGKIVEFQRAGRGSLSPPRHDYEFDIPLEDVASSCVTEFDTYWRSKARRGQIPARSDIDPADFKSILPNVILLNVLDDPFRISVRLRGTRIDEFRPKGKWTYLHEATTFDRGRREDYLREMEFVVRNRRPVYARDWMTSRFGALCDLYAGIWPLSSDGERVDMLVVIEDFDRLEPEDFELS
ncbi:PAS domain-containing protein [Dongia deserti]|uniref:PAS domain-containing protein n=1 Tax=Dongia deserti TaxID=2268030 RepID=UPI000E6579F2|nr:PAS domain-containing protein [Dongia deserti]